MSHFSGDVGGEVQIGLLGNEWTLLHVIITSVAMDKKPIQIMYCKMCHRSKTGNKKKRKMIAHNNLSLKHITRELKGSEMRSGWSYDTDCCTVT